MEPDRIENPEIPPLSSHLQDDRRGLITKILQHQDLDSLLRLSVVLCNHELQGDGCSLFIYDDENSEIVLKESTVLTRFLGQRVRVDRAQTQNVVDSIRRSIEGHSYHEDPWTRTLSSDEDHLEPAARELIFHFGLTRWSYWFNAPLLIDDVRNDLRWSSHRRGGSGAFLIEPFPQPADLPTKELGHCELPHNEMGSIIVAPIGHSPHGIPRGVMRVVRKRKRPGFQEEDLLWLKWFTQIIGTRIETAISLSDLTDLGTRLEVADFGRTLVKILRRTLKAKGCSIFLEMDRQDPESNERVFQCVATNGLVSNGRHVDLEARYEIQVDKEETDHLTTWVLRHGQLIALKDVHDFDVSDFPMLHRRPGQGKFSETDAEGQKFEVGPILIAPLFLYQGREVAGAIRISRPRGEVFETHEQLLFLDISKRLSRVLTNLHLRQLSEKMIELYNSPEEMLKRIPREVCRLLGVDGCSVLLRRGDLLTLAATAGALKGQEGSIGYNLRDPHLRGWTGWVAHTKRALLLNAPADVDRYTPDPPRHVKEEEKKPCETGEHAYRFLAVPILGKPGDADSEVFGVVRVPRKEADPPFEEIHQSILVSFAGRLSLALNLARRNKQLEAVARLPDVGGALEDPKAIAGHIVERAVDVLTDDLGFTLGAIYMLDTRTGEISLRHGRSLRADHEMSLRQEISYSAEGENVHARTIRLRNAETIEGWEPESESSIKEPGLKRFVCPILLGRTALGTIEAAVPLERKISAREENMVRLLAGFCANALYNEAVFRKLDELGKSLVRIGTEMTEYSPLQKKLEVIAKAAAQVTKADNVIIHEYLGPPPSDGSLRGLFRESSCGGPRPPHVWKKVDNSRDAVPFRIVEQKEPLFAELAETSAVIFHKKADQNFIEREQIRSVAALPLTVDEMPVGCIFFNFTRRQKFEAQRKQEIQMMAEYAAVAIYQARLLEEKSSLLRYAEHSLNQPLNAMLGYLGNLADGDYNADLGTDSLRDVEEFRRSPFARMADQQYELCEYLCYLVKTFLHIDRLETESRQTGADRHKSPDLFVIRPVSDRDLSNLCQRAAGVAEAYLLGSSSGSVTTQIQANVTGYFDENAIQMSLLNLLVNAVKHGKPRDRFTPGGIHLTLRATQENGTPSALILVEDAGPGIPEAERELIFEKGYQRENGGPGGLGIGLFLTRGYIAAHGGRISVESSRFGGAGFVIRLPLAKQGGAA